MPRKEPSKAKERKRKKARIPETGLVDIIKDGLKNDHYLQTLYSRNDPTDTSEQRIQRIADYLNLFWRCVKKTWPDVWKKPTSEQRLTHKAGLIAMTQLMPIITQDIDVTKSDAEEK